MQIGEDAPQRLFGDGEEAEEFAHGQAGLARDEIERAVVGAAKPFIGEQRVGAADHAGVAEIEQLDATSDFVFAQEEGGGGRDERRSGRRSGRCGEIWDSHVDISCMKA